MTSITSRLRFLGWTVAIVLFGLVIVHSSVASALDKATQGLLFPMYGENDVCGSADIVNASNTTGSGLTLSEVQVNHIKIMLGTTKSLGLNDKAGEIAIMVALAESGIKMYASDPVPISQKNPAWLALPTPPPRPIGRDHDSVGFFQQRVTANWSTFVNASGKSASEVNSNQNAVWQLMDPAYGAQAFLGTAPGTKLPDLANPGALKKGLQNVEGWQSMQPWEAAQKVQISAYDGRPRPANNNSSIYGENYKNQYLKARSIVAKYWNESPAVPLPISPSSTGTPTATNIDCASTSVGTGDYASIIAKVKEYAWEKYTPPNYLKKKPAYKAAIDAAQKRGEYVGGGDGIYAGIDCGGFVTRVMRDSKADPKYNDKQDRVAEQIHYLERHPEMYEHVAINSTKDLQPNTIYIWINSERTHTYMYVGQIPGYEHTAASASISFTNTSWRTPMSSPPYGFGNDADWFKVKINSTTGAVSI